MNNSIDKKEFRMGLFCKTHYANYADTYETYAEVLPYDKNGQSQPFSGKIIGKTVKVKDIRNYFRH